MKRIHCGIGIAFVCFVCCGVFSIAFTIIGLLADISALYGLIITGVFFLIGFLFFSIWIVEYDNETIHFKFWPSIKTKVIQKGDIKQVFLTHPRGRYQVNYTIILNMDGRLNDMPASGFMYKSVCRAKGMNNLIEFVIARTCDLDGLFASHPGLIEEDVRTPRKGDRKR